MKNGPSERRPVELSFIVQRPRSPAARPAPVVTATPAIAGHPDRPAATEACSPTVPAATHPPHVIDDIGIDQRRLQRRRRHRCGARAGRRNSDAYGDRRCQRKQNFAHGILPRVWLLGTRSRTARQVSRSPPCSLKRTPIRLNCVWEAHSSGVHAEQQVNAEYVTTRKC